MKKILLMLTFCTVVLLANEGKKSFYSKDNSKAYFEMNQKRVSVLESCLKQCKTLSLQSDSCKPLNKEITKIIKQQKSLKTMFNISS